jgi:Family of unknown function (DUF6118)
MARPLAWARAWTVDTARWTRIARPTSTLASLQTRLTDERTSQPDHPPSLEAIGKRLEDVCVWARRVSEKPAMKLTPESLSREITAAAASSRTQDHQHLERAASAMEAASNRIDAMIARSRTVADQNRELAKNRVAFAVAGMVLCAILPGAIARSLPVSWAVPERIAARMLGTDMWHAGQNMMAKADPQRWSKIVARERDQAVAAPK